MGYNRIAPEGKSTNWVKFQTVPVSTKCERISYPAESDKKVHPGVKVRSQFFFGIRGCAQRRASTFFACVQDLFDEALSPQYGKRCFIDFETE